MAIDMTELEAIDDVNALPGGFPSPDLLKPFLEAEVQEIARSFVPSITKILQDCDEEELEKLYYADGFFRDQVSLTWTFRTFHTRRCAPSNTYHDFCTYASVSPVDQHYRRACPLAPPTSLHF